MTDDFDDIGAEDESPTAPFWMITFSDMVTLLLVFFVLIVSMSEVEIKRFKQALSYFNGQTGVLTQKAIVPSLTASSAPRSPSMQKTEKYEAFMAKLKEHNLADQVEANLTKEGLHITITDSVMFPSGEARLIEPSRTILKLLSQVLTEDVKAIVVEGHTDNRPISTDLYPSNWELSAARAASVIRFLRNQPNALDPERHIAIGYGEYHPIASNATPEGRAKNRRVEILLSWDPWQNQIAPSPPGTQL